MTRIVWFMSGSCFGLLALIFWYAQLTPFAVGSAIVGFFMMLESLVKEEK